LQALMLLPEYPECHCGRFEHKVGRCLQLPRPGWCSFVIIFF